MWVVRNLNTFAYGNLRFRPLIYSETLPAPILRPAFAVSQERGDEQGWVERSRVLSAAPKATIKKFFEKTAEPEVE